MKPFGVRLAAGAVTILLGAIMAAQAQKDHQNERNSAWNPSLDSSLGVPPAPILPENNTIEPLDPDSEPSPFADVPDAVKLVQHTEPAPGGLSIPDGALPTFAEAGARNDAAAAAKSMQLPESGSNVNSMIADALALPTKAESLPSATAEDIAAQAKAILENAKGSASAQMNNLVGDLSNETPAQPVANQGHGNMLRGEGSGSLRAPANVEAQHGQASTFNTGTFNPPANISQDMGQHHELAAEFGPPENVSPQMMQAEPSQLLRAVTLPGHASHADQLAGQHAGTNGGTFGQADVPQLPQQSRPVLKQNFDAMNGTTMNGTAMNTGPSPMDRGVANQFRPQKFGGNVQNNSFNNGFNQPAAGFPTAQVQSTSPMAPPLQDNPHVRSGGTTARIASLTNPRDQNFGTSALPAAHQLRGDPNASFAQPGDRRLEGAQAPSVVIHKRAPSEVKVGKPASFVIHVQNVGTAEAIDVRVHDRVPVGMRLIDASPKPQATADGSLVWQLGALSANEERTVTMQLVPEQEGELGSVARVTFEAAASVRTISTRPEIKIVQRAPAQVLIGQQLEIELEVSNPGTGNATGVMLQEDVPDGLEHPKGRQLDNLIGTLRPGEVRRQILRMRAVAPGVVKNTIRLKADDGLETNHSVNVQVVSPDLKVALTGPKRRFLERQATFNLQVANTGTYEATNVQIAAYLDRGFTFVSTEHEGQYDPSRHAVFWELENLPQGVAPAQVPLTLLPVQEGNRAIRLEAKADLGIVANHDSEVAVDSLAELTFQINDSADPVEVGGETTYEIKLSNSGSRQDSNVRVQLQFPPGVEVIGSDSEVQTDGRGLVAFRPRAQLSANSEVVYRVKARGVQPGTHLIKAVVTSDQSQVPVTKEESTMVYADQ